MASSIQFMRGLQAKVNAANIKDGQPALVRRSGKTPLLFVGNGSGVGKAVQLAPDADMYKDTGVTTDSNFRIRRNTDNADNWSQLNFDKLDDSQYAGVFFPYHSVNVDLGKASNRFRNTYTRTIDTKQINAEDTASIIGQATSPFMSSYVLRQITPIIESVYNPDDGSQTGNTELQLRSYPGAANATTASKVGTAAFVLRSSKWVSDANQYSYAKVLLEPDASSPNNAVIRPDVDGRGFLGTSAYQWNSVYSKYVNAQSGITTAGALNAQSSTINGTLTVTGALRTARSADSNDRIFNIFADASAAAADTTAYGTATQLVTYYKNGANAEPTPHYLRFQASSDTSATLTFSRENTGDTVGIGSSALPFDWLYAKNVYSTGTAYLQNGATVAGTIAPSSVGGAMLGTSTNRFGDCYFGNITVGSITPINGTSYSLGTSSAPFNLAYINTATIKTALNPDASGGATLGSSTLPWGTAYLGSTYTYTIMPRSDSSYSLGSSSIRWSTIYGDTVNVATGIVPDANTGAYIGTSTNRFTTSYFSTLNVSMGLMPDSAGGAYVGTSTSYMSTGYFTNLYNRGSYNSNYRIPVIRYGSGEPPTSGMSTGDVYIRYES